ncbi:MAG: MMPL family transporter [Deltaproteobacteria bacterium]|nr:MMPL family transporter [Deltaproteobacteria bacterium]
MKHSSPDLSATVMAWEQRLLRTLASFTITYAKTVIIGSLVLTALAATYTVQHLQFISDRNDLVSAEKRYLQLDEEYTREFMGVDELVVIVEPRDVQQGKDFVARLADRLSRDTAHVADIFHRIDTTSLEGKKLLYLSAEDLHSLRENVVEHRDLVQTLTSTPGLNPLLESINTQVSAGLVSHLVEGLFGLDAPSEPAPTAGEQKPVKIGFLKSLLQELDRALSTPAYSYHSPWAQFFGETDELADNGYLVSDNRRFVFLMVEPKSSTNGEMNAEQESIAAIRNVITELKPQFPGLDAGVTGTTAINNDELAGAQANSNVAAVVSLVGVTLLYLLFFKKHRHPLIIVTSLTVGLLWSMGLATATVGHLTIITAFVAPILIGLADDFGVHFVTRYEQEREQGCDPTAALTNVFEQTVPGIIAGGFTSSLAFFAVMLSDFQGVRELGQIAGGGLIVSLMATLTFLPALIVVTETYHPWVVVPGGRSFLTGAFASLGAVMVKARWSFLTVAGVLTLASLVAIPTVTFDYNLLNLQAREVESVKWERRIIANSERSSWIALSAASTPEEAARKAAAFAALSSVESVESVASLLPEDQERRMPLVQALQPVLHEFPQALETPQSVQVPDLLRTLEKLKLKLREDNDKWDPRKKPDENDLSAARRSLLAIIDRLHALPAEQGQALVDGFQQSLFRDFADKWSLLRNNLNPSGPITLADIPPQLKSRFVNQDGTKFLLQIYSKYNIWDREPLEEFITQLRQVDADVTGSPVIGYESIDAMRKGYIEGGFYALIAIVIVAFFSLRSVKDTFLAMIPLGLGMVWTAGLMWLFDLKFNLANLIVVPLILGIGVENGIHLVHRYREEGEGGITLITGSTGQAVTLFSLTTMIGFGSLMLATHRGVFSMGLLLMTAVGSVLMASLFVLPLLLFHPVRKVEDEPQTSLGLALDLPEPGEEKR